MGSIPVGSAKKSHPPEADGSFLALPLVNKPSPNGKAFGIGFANSAKGRSVLARELLDEFSSLASLPVYRWWMVYNTVGLIFRKIKNIFKKRLTNGYTM